MLHNDASQLGKVFFKDNSYMIGGRVDATHDMSTKMAGSVSPVSIQTGHVDATQDKSSMMAGKTAGF